MPAFALQRHPARRAWNQPRYAQSGARTQQGQRGMLYGFATAHFAQLGAVDERQRQRQRGEIV